MPLSSNRSRAEPTLEQVCAWENLLLAWRKAARGKRGKPGVAAFEHQVADRLLDLQRRLAEGTWQPGGYVHFTIAEPKRRVISAAPFADRVVHHALCNVIEPVFEALFIPDSHGLGGATLSETTSVLIAPAPPHPSSLIPYKYQSSNRL